MSAIRDMYDDWVQTLETQTRKKQALQKERKPLQDDIDAFDKGAPTGLWGKLKHQMIKNVGLSPIRDKIGKIDTQIGNAHYGITSKAQEIYNYLADYALSLPACAPILAAKTDEERLLQVISAGHEATVETIKACEYASQQEWLDLASESVQQQAASFQATRHARRMLQEVKVTLNDMARQANDVKISLHSGVNSTFQYTIFEASLTQAMHPSTSLPANELNKMNALGLTDAANALKSTERQLKSMIDQLGRDIESATGQAIGVARAADPELDKLAAAITPHLPGNLASHISRRYTGPAPPRP